MKKTPKDFVNLPLRIAILELLQNRELKVREIKNCLVHEYQLEEYTFNDVQGTLRQLQRNKLISRRKISEKERNAKRGPGPSRYAYTSNKRGRERKEYYRRKLEEGALSGE